MTNNFLLYLPTHGSSFQIIEVIINWSRRKQYITLSTIGPFFLWVNHSCETPRLRAARRHPLAPRLKAGDAPSRRCRLGAQGATRSTSAPRSPTSFFSFSFFFFFFFSFSSSPASGCRGQREALTSFFIFWDQNDVVLDIFKKGQNDVVLDLFILKRTGQNDAVLALFSLPAPFSGCLQPNNSPKFCPSLSRVVEK